MEFELDEYLGLPTDFYNMEGGEGDSLQIIGIGSSEIKKDISVVLNQAVIIVKGNTQKEKIDLKDISGSVIAVTGSAVHDILSSLNQYKNDDTNPSILKNLFQESTSENVTTLLNETKQFAFISIFYDLHARAILNEIDNVPKFESSFLDKYTWFANFLKDAKENDIIPSVLTKDQFVERWNKNMKVKITYEEIIKMILNPPNLIEFLQDKEGEGEGEGEGEDMSATVENVVENTTKKLESNDELEGVINDILNKVTNEIQPTVGGVFAEPKTAEEYIMDLGEFVA